MRFANTTYGGTVEFLAADDFKAIPGHVTETDVVLAGTPIDADGKKIKTGATGAVGILLYDVDPTRNPNGALLVEGIIDLKKMNAHSGLTVGAAALKTVLPGIVCRENIGVNE